MKFILILSTLVAGAFASHLYADSVIDKEHLWKELQDFEELMPVDKILKIFLAYSTNDKEFINLMNFIQLQEFKFLAGIIQNTPEAANFLNYLERSGIEAYRYLREFNDWLGITPKESQSYSNMEITGGLNGLATDLRAVMPFDEIEALHEEKMKTSPVYAAFIARMTSPEFEKIIRDLHRNNLFVALVVTARTANVDIAAARQVACVLIGLREC